jgi:hypothetical protein
MDMKAVAETNVEAADPNREFFRAIGEEQIYDESDEETRKDIRSIIDIAPQDDLEMMLVVELIVGHRAACECYRYGISGGVTPDGFAYLNLANKLSRTFVLMLGALDRHREKAPTIERNRFMRAGHKAERKANSAKQPSAAPPAQKKSAKQPSAPPPTPDLPCAPATKAAPVSAVALAPRGVPQAESAKQPSAPPLAPVQPSAPSAEAASISAPAVAQAARRAEPAEAGAKTEKQPHAKATAPAVKAAAELSAELERLTRVVDDALARRRKLEE